MGLIGGEFRGSICMCDDSSNRNMCVSQGVYTYIQSSCRHNALHSIIYTEYFKETFNP